MALLTSVGRAPPPRGEVEEVLFPVASVPDSCILVQLQASKSSPFAAGFVHTMSCT